MEIGESLVGAYLRHVRDCDVVLFNTHLADEQGEIDLIGIATINGQQHVWLVEVTTHIRGMLYSTQAQTVAKLKEKRRKAQKFAEKTFGGAECSFEVWSPVVPSGLVDAIASSGITLVANKDYTKAVNELAAVAAQSTATTGNDAFRMLQLLTHLRGAKPIFQLPKAND